MRRDSWAIPTWTTKELREMCDEIAPNWCELRLLGPWPGTLRL